MKVVINACFGGFGLSDVAVEACIARGMTARRFTEDGSRGRDESADFIEYGNKQFGHRFYPRDGDRNEFRCNPIVVAVVEELGGQANSDCSGLKVVDIPFDDAEGWEIDDYDGKEKVVPCHSSWS